MSQAAEHPPITPARIRLEATTVCQLKCPSCPTAAGEIAHQIGAGFLRYRDFQRLIDRYPWIYDIELSNWGELFLNPDLLSIIKYAYQRDVILRADNGVNMNTASQEQLEALVKYHFRSLTCSIDGASQATYQIYRRGGNFDRVIAHIKQMNSYKAKYRSRFPVLKWQFVPFGHNEHEIPTARQLARELKMDFAVKLSWSTTVSPVKNLPLVRKESGLGVATREEYRTKYGTSYRRPICTQLWSQPQLNWDGTVLGCCVNRWGDFGNAFTEGLVESLNGEKINYARQMLLGKKEGRADIPCTTCEFYQQMKSNGTWLQDDEVSRTSRLSRFRRIWMRAKRTLSSMVSG